MGGRLDLSPVMAGLERVAGRLLEGHEPPRVGMVRQLLSPPVLDSRERDARVRAEVRLALDGAAPRRVAVGVGSRGIAEIGPIVAAVIAELRELGFDPFVVPAMGSHGAATAEGQAERPEPDQLDLF